MSPQMGRTNQSAESNGYYHSRLRMQRQPREGNDPRAADPAARHRGTAVAFVVHEDHVTAVEDPEVLLTIGELGGRRGLGQVEDADLLPRADVGRITPLARSTCYSANNPRRFVWNSSLLPSESANTRSALSSPPDRSSRMVPRPHSSLRRVGRRNYASCWDGVAGEPRRRGEDPLLRGHEPTACAPIRGGCRSSLRGAQQRERAGAAVAPQNGGGSVSGSCGGVGGGGSGCGGGSSRMWSSCRPSSAGVSSGQSARPRGVGSGSGSVIGSGYIS